MNPVECQCACGATRFQTLGAPLFRIYCHCTICQRFNNAPFADILVHRAEDVALPPARAVIFDTYKPPPNVQRGKCASCGQPAIVVLAAPFLPRLVTVLRPMFRPDAELPSPVAHIFYDKRLADAEDPYPKHEGYFRSNIAFLKYLRMAKRP
jgi:hypothetical protein